MLLKGTKKMERLERLFTFQRLQGLVVGIIGTIAIGMFGFWTTDGNARIMAAQQADAAVVEILAPLCAVQARQDPDVTRKLATLTELVASSEQQRFMFDAGWVTLGDVKLPPRREAWVAAECRQILLKQESI